MLTFQIASDLHIECNTQNYLDPLSFITPVSDILILAGDIGSFYKLNQLKTFLIDLCIHFKIVLYIPGNHEYYTQNCYKKERMDILFFNFKTIKDHIDNLYILNRSSVQIEDVCIVGCTLWSEPKIEVPKFIVRIEEMNTENYHETHKDDLYYIKTMIKYCKRKEKKLLIVTHYPPTYSVITKLHKKKDKYISLYANNLDYLLNKNNLHTWIAGHIHTNFDLITEGGVRLVSNQLGKPKDNIKDYNKKMTVII